MTKLLIPEMFVADKRYVQVCTQYQKLRKNGELQFLLKLLNSIGKGGTMVSSKNCDLSKNCVKLEKSQFLLKLIKSSVTGGRRVPSKNWDFCNFWGLSKKLRKIRNNCNDPW